MLIDWLLKNIFDVTIDEQLMQVQWMKYYLKTCLVGLTNLILLIVLSLLLKTVLATFIVYCVMIVLRPVAGGWHAKKRVLCTIQTITFYVLIPLVLQLFTYDLSYLVKFLLAGIVVTLFYCFAPQGTEIEPVKEEHVESLKKKSLQRVLFLLLLFFILPEPLGIFVLYGVIVQAFLIVPVTKKIIEGVF